MSTYRQRQSIVSLPRLVKTDSTPAHCEASYIKDGEPSGYTGMNLDLRHWLWCHLRAATPTKKGKGHLSGPTKVTVIRGTSLELLCIPILNDPSYEDTSAASSAEWGHMCTLRKESVMSDLLSWACLNLTLLYSFLSPCNVLTQIQACFLLQWHIWTYVPRD